MVSGGGSRPSLFVIGPSSVGDSMYSCNAEAQNPAR
jgi:hypothetical protein